MKTQNKIGIAGLVVLSGLFLLPSHRLSNRYAADEPVGIAIESGTWNDGVYTGSATGFQPGIEVEVEILEGELKRISVIDHSEIGIQFWQRPVNLIPDAIVEARQTDVDVVGGATSTSHGIMAAVENALSKAQG